MGWFDDAVSKGVAEGFASSLADACDGKDNPEERCPLSPSDGCACRVRDFDALPWWKKVLRERPPVPPPAASHRALCHIKIEAAILNELSKKRAAQ